MLQARRLGKELLVGVHSDEEISDNKGPTVMTLAERLVNQYSYGFQAGLPFLFLFRSFRSSILLLCLKLLIRPEGLPLWMLADGQQSPSRTLHMLLH